MKTTKAASRSVDLFLHKWKMSELKKTFENHTTCLDDSWRFVRDKSKRMILHFLLQNAEKHVLTSFSLWLWSTLSGSATIEYGEIFCFDDWFLGDSHHEQRHMLFSDLENLQAVFWNKQQKNNIAFIDQCFS